MPQDVSDDPHLPEIERLRQDVRALRHEIARRDVLPVARGPRGAVMVAVIGLGTIGGAMLAAGMAIDIPTVPGLAMMAEAVSTQAAVGIVERLFAVY